MLKVSNLNKYFYIKSSIFAKPRIVKAVDGVSLRLTKGEILGVVGETGSGKSTLAKIIVGLCSQDSGSIEFEDKAMGDTRSRNQSKDIQMVFQDPYNSLDPKMKIRDTLKEGLISHKMLSAVDIEERVKSLLDMVELPLESLDKYPHEFSGGEKQRIAIARAISVEPKILICDEPVSSLDVSIQAKILKLLLRLKDDFDLSYIFISHDISVVKAIADKVAVMYDGKIIEEGYAKIICNDPKEAYTKELMRAGSYASSC